MRRCLPELPIFWIWLLCISIGTASLVAHGDEGTEEELAAINAAIEDIQQWMGAAERDLDNREQELQHLNRSITESERAITVNQQQIDAAGQELQTLQARESELEAQLEQQEEIVARALRASWMSGDDSPLKMLLNQEDPALAARMMRYYEDFNRSRLTQIERYQQDLQALEDTRTAIEQTTARLEERNKTLSLQLASLSADRQQQQGLVAQLQDRMSGRHRELEELIADREELEALLEEINRIIVDIPAPEEMQVIADARGQLPWPLQGQVVSGFGARYSDGSMVRQGVVIAAEAGTPARAVHHGRVVFADWLRGSGLLVVVDHGQGFISLYARNGALNKQSGDWVNRGEPVGTAGPDAGTGDPGLYFEIRQNGQPLDPVQWFVPR